MEKYINEKCPVCEKDFQSGDDIVVCPECGTPHHRECYNSIHHCANASKHSEGFTYTESEKPKEEPVYSSPEEEFQAMLGAKQTQERRFCHKCGKPVDAGASMCMHCGAELEELPAKDYTQFSEQMHTDEEIDGETVSDIAAAVGTNSARFIPRFKANKKFSWNWSAFIFGPYYLFYRKMYRAGIIAMIINLAMSFVCQGIYAEEYSAFADLLQSKTYRDLLSSSPLQNSDLINQLSQESAYKAVIPMFIGMLIISLVIRIFCGLFADSIYRQQTLRTVRAVNKRLEEGDYFAPNPLFPNQQNENINQKQMKLLFLSRRGGVSFFAPIAAYFAIDLIVSLISRF